VRILDAFLTMDCTHTGSEYRLLVIHHPMLAPVDLNKQDTQIAPQGSWAHIERDLLL
jgi:hypothetical protein